MLLRRLPFALLLLGCGDEGRPGPIDPDGGDADVDTDVDSDADSDSDTGEPVDSDGDGFFDHEEAKCGSDPEDVASTCYACGWRRGDPGDLVATGSREGDTIDNVDFYDQCGDIVPLWDFAGEYHVIYLTATWCTACLPEVATFPDRMAEAEAGGYPFGYIVVHYEGSDAGPPSTDDVSSWAEKTGLDIPFLADAAQIMPSRLPVKSGFAIPFRCALSPRMEIIEDSCYQGEAPKTGDIAMEQIRLHVEASGG